MTMNDSEERKQIEKTNSDNFRRGWVSIQIKHLYIFLNYWLQFEIYIINSYNELIFTTQLTLWWLYLCSRNKKKSPKIKERNLNNKVVRRWLLSECLSSVSFAMKDFVTIWHFCNADATIDETLLTLADRLVFCSITA